MLHSFQTLLPIELASLRIGGKIEAVLEVFLPSNLSTAEQQQRSVEALWNYLQSAMQLQAGGSLRTNTPPPFNLTPILLRASA